MIALSLLAGCGCGADAPVWSDLADLYLGGEAKSVDLSAFVTDDGGELTFAVEYPEGLIAEIDDAGQLTVTPQPDFTGEAVLWITATDACGTERGAELWVAAEGLTRFSYRPVGTPDAVAVAGSFNDWDPEATLLADQGDGTYAVELPLPPGPYTYKFIEIDRNSFDDAYGWTCDPNAELIACALQTGN